MKKKVTLLAALAMAVTVGGVYATWTYTQGAAVTATTEFTVKLAGESIKTEPVGTLAVVANGGIRIDDTNNDYIADVVIAESTYFTVSLSDVKSGVDLDALSFKYTLAVTGVPSLDGMTENILTINKTDTLTIADFTLSDGVYKTGNITISADDFTWSQTLSLPTYADYVNYRDNVLKTAKITITVEDVTVY